MKGKWERDDPLKKIEETVIENGEKLDELMKGVSGEKKCAMVVLGDAYSGSQQTSFSPYHVVTNEDERKFERKFFIIAKSYAAFFNCQTPV